MSILVLGTVALDTVKTPFGRRQRLLGGSASHFAMSARLFTGVDLVAVVGEDFPEKHIAFFKSKGINLTSLVRAKGKTFHWSGEYQGDLNSALTLSTELGVLSSFRPKVSREQKKQKYIFLANVDPEIQMSLLKSIYSPQLVACDSMNYWISSKRPALLRLLKKVDIFVANDQEARSLSGKVNLIEAAKSLRCLGPKMVLIKKGEHGVLFYSDKFFFALPAFPTHRVADPTGAGDTFAGGFMGYLARSGRLSPPDIRKALAYGTVLASFNVEGFGLERTSRLTMREVNGRLKRFKEHISF
jgi:sugar/nucleoside kinase (ribokinase family)